MKASGQKGKKKQGTLKTRKSIGSRNKGSDDDEDFKPVKAAPKKKRLQSRRRNVRMMRMTTCLRHQHPSAPQLPRRSQGTSLTMTLTLSRFKSSAPRKKPVAKSKLPESDSDDDVVVVAKSTDKGKEKAKPAPKRKRYITSVPKAYTQV